MIRATINEHVYDFEDKLSILEGCQSVGITLPTLCHDERLKPIGACRLCLVAVQGRPHSVAACNTPLAGGMVISTQTPELEDKRRMLLKMLARDYPVDGLQQFPEKEFYRYAVKYGLTNADFDGVRDPQLVDESHPYIHVDMSQCVLCYRCVRICDEVQGQFVWQILNRGHESRIVPDSGTTLRESTCVSCGACVDTCPTGALEDKSILARGTPTAWTRTTCPYCGTGCEMNVGTREVQVAESTAAEDITRNTTSCHLRPQKQLVSIKPILDAPVSRGHLCVKGRYAFDFVSASDRITEPMIRQNDKWHCVTWDEAVSFTASRLQHIARQYGPDSVAVLGSARGTNEENYLAQKFARVVIGTNNVDCCARVCHTPTAAAMKLMLGTGAATNSYDDIERARTILICGANATENHPILGARIKQAVLGGARLIVIDPREIELARFATIHLQIRPGTNIPLLNALAFVILDEQLFDADFIRDRVADWNEFHEFARQFSPEQAAQICGVKADQIRAAARLYAKAKPSICFHGLGVTEHTQGTEGVMCLVNLALLTGNLGKPGTGVNPLRGQNNVQGAAQMGCDPGILTGSVSLSDARERFERVWSAPIPERSGLNLLEMMDSAADGKLKALWAIGYDVFLTNANTSGTESALRALEFVIVQDMFLNETAREFGSVFLPSASSFERDGTFMNAERRIQRIRKAMEPVGCSRTDWEIICEIAHAMGKGTLFDYGSAEDIWNEIRSVWEGVRGITYARLEAGGLQWPCPAEDHPGTEMLHAETFPVGKTARLHRIPFRPTGEIVNEEFPFLLITGRTLNQFNAGTMTMRTGNRDLQPTDVLDISSEDAMRLQFQSAERVRIRSRYGETTLPVRITPSVRPGELFTTFHTSDVFLNRVTSPHRDRYVKTPEYKITAVRVEKE